MGCFRNIRIFALVFASTISLTMGVVGQTKSCTSGSITFLCPPSYETLLYAQKVEPFIARNKQSDIILFLSQLDANDAIDSEPAMTVLDKALRLGFSVSYKDVTQKDSKDFWGDIKYSKFEQLKAAKVFFNVAKNEVIHSHYAIIKFEDKRFLAGFAVVMIKSPNAATRFNEWIGGGGTGESELQNLIHLITKETKSGASMGDPPPAAAPPKKP